MPTDAIAMRRPHGWGARARALLVALVVAQLVGLGPGVGGVLGAGPAVADTQPAPPRPGLTVSLVNPPVDPDDPRSMVYILGHHRPGDVIRRTIEVANGDQEPMSLRVGVAAAQATDEWTVPGALGEGELASWASTSVDEFVLEPGQRRHVEVTVTIPADAAGGQRYGAILAEHAVIDGSATRLLNRVGIRMYLSVGGPEAPISDFVIDAMRPLRTAEGDPAVWIKVTNTGERVLDIAGDLRLTEGPGQLSAGPFSVVVPRTLGPGYSGEVVVELDPSLPAGPWLAIAELTGGPVQRRAQATITFPTGAPIDPGTTGPQGENLGEPVPASPLLDRGLLLPIDIALLLLAIFAVWWFWWRRRRDDEDDDQAEPPLGGDEVTQRERATVG